MVSEPLFELNGFICEEQSNTIFNVKENSILFNIIVPCFSNICKNDGTCFLNNGKIKCFCKEGFYGWFCEQTADLCEIFPYPCKNYGICENYNKTYVCQCTSSYKGNSCEIEIKDEQENVRKIVTVIVLAIFSLVLLVFCLMDLPLNKMIKILNLIQ
jgi:hypothetical protein